MKLILQLVVAVAIVIACARGGESAWRYYGLKDAVEQEMRFGGAKTSADLHRRVFELGQENGVALNFEDIAITAQSGQVTVNASYVEDIALVPGLYTRRQEFDIDLTVRIVTPFTVNEP